MTAGRYIDFSDSYHIYGQDLENFERGFLQTVEKRAEEDRYWNLQDRHLDGLVQDGENRARQMVKSRDENNKITDGRRMSTTDYTVPVEVERP